MIGDNGPELFCTQKLARGPATYCTLAVNFTSQVTMVDGVTNLCCPCRPPKSRARRSGGRDSAHLPLRLVLMSATADADLFAQYMHQQAPQGSLAATTPVGSTAGVGMLTIPGFTYPVRELYLEDILERTGHVIGRGSRYSKKGQKDDAWDGPGSEQYSEQTRRSMANVDENQVSEMTTFPSQTSKK